MRIERFQGEYPSYLDNVVYNVTQAQYLGESPEKLVERGIVERGYDPTIYNVTPAEYWGEAPDPKKDKNTYFWTTQGPPPPKAENESEDVRQGIIQCVHRYLQRVDFRRLDDFGRPVWGPTDNEYEVFISNIFDDRTHGFQNPFNDERILTEELIESLQREVLAQMPLWRIGVFDSEPGEVLMIYPDAIRAHSLPASLPQREALARWLPGYYKRMERDADPVRRQFRWAYPRALAALPTLKEKKLQVVEVFDRYENITECYALWILHTQPWLVTRIDGDMRMSQHFPLGPNGEIGPDQWSAEKDDIPYWLTCISKEKDEPNQCIITHGVITRGGVEYDFTINPAEVIDDATLRQWDEQHPPS